MALNGIHRTFEYLMITEFYGTRTAARSKVPLINHINEGLYIMEKRGVSGVAQRAFCLHPMLQHENDLEKNWMDVATNANRHSVLLAMEYRNIANQYLSHRQIVSLDDITLSPIPEVNEMLVADKIQNYKDFIIYHKGTHPRSDALDEYFNNWLMKLHVTNFEEWFEELKSI